MLIACDNRPLVISDDLSVAQIKAWREALNFPSYCENGKYEFKDESSPIMYFISTEKEKTYLYNVCERYAYQDVVNVFVLNQNDQKPQVINFPIIELDESTVKYTDDNNKALKVPKAEFKVTKSALVVQRNIEILPNGQMVVTRHYSGPGTCGTLTTYKLVNAEASAVEFRAQVSCDNTQHDMTQWPRYKIDCANDANTADCRIKTLFDS